MKNENLIYCSNCGNKINLNSKYCFKCGFKQIEILEDFNSEDLNLSINEDNEIKKLDNSRLNENIKNNYNNVGAWIALILLLVAIWSLFPKTSSDYSNSTTNDCTGFGSESCISTVRQNFTNTGKTILGEQYLGDGRFGISFMDSQHPGAYNATISTDCKCNIINSNVSTIR